MKTLALLVFSIFLFNVTGAQVKVGSPRQDTKVDTSKSKTIIVKKNVKISKPNSCSEVKYKSGRYYSKKDTGKLYTGECAEYWSEGKLRAWYKYKDGTITYIERYDQYGLMVEKWENLDELPSTKVPKPP